jgi:lipopolysaccharide/colanic/teichoic acid biosynthesis glycosyltransferase
MRVGFLNRNGMMNQNQLSYRDEPTIRRKKKHKPSGRESGARYAPAILESPPRPPALGHYAALKRGFDFVFALALFIITLPIMAIAAALVRLTSMGPAIYVQTRLGAGGIPFRIYKIRTMIHNCESLTGPRWAVPGDPRITSVGAVLRALHIDELPQLWNVIRGDMSLIGPRPERPEIVDNLVWQIPRYYERLAAKPGITGLAQVQLPPDTEVKNVADKLVLDLSYIENFGFTLDAKIFACTLLKLLTMSPQNYRFVLRSALPPRIDSEFLLAGRAAAARHVA